jgi:hypothetical protein
LPLMPWGWSPGPRPPACRETLPRCPVRVLAFDRCGAAVRPACP